MNLDELKPVLILKKLNDSKNKIKRVNKIIISFLKIWPATLKIVNSLFGNMDL